MSYTPGPWKVIADSVVTGDWVADFATEEDAHLVAAAPDLLEALKMVIARETGDHGEHDWTSCMQPSCALARNAIAKAEGKNS